MVSLQSGNEAQHPHALLIHQRIVPSRALGAELLGGGSGGTRLGCRQSWHVHQNGPSASAALSLSIPGVSSEGVTGEITEHLEMEAGLACAQGFSIATQSAP